MHNICKYDKINEIFTYKVSINEYGINIKNSINKLPNISILELSILENFYKNKF